MTPLFLSVKKWRTGPELMMCKHDPAGWDEERAGAQQGGYGRQAEAQRLAEAQTVVPLPHLPVQ